MRLAIKTSTYGLLHVMVAMLVAYALTGKIKIASGFGLIEPVIQMIVFSNTCGNRRRKTVTTHDVLKTI